MARKKSEEEKKREAEADAYIQQREKRASQLSQSGQMSVKSARKQAAKSLNQQLQAKSAAGEQITVEESRAATEERKAALQKGLEIATSLPEAPVVPGAENQQTILGELGKQIGATQLVPPYLGGEPVQVPVGAKAAVAAGALGALGGAGAVGSLFARKLTLQAAARTGLKTGVAAAGGFFSLKALLGNPSKRIESTKTATTTLGEQISQINSGLDAGLDPITALETTAEYRRELAVKEENLKLLMIHSIQQQVNPEKAQDAVEEINKMRTKIYFAEQKALQKLAAGEGEFNPEEFEAWMEDSGFKFPKQLIPKEKGEVPFRPFAKEGVDFANI